MIPRFYRRYVDDTLAKMVNIEPAKELLQLLNDVHPRLSFIMELEHDSSIPLLGMVITRSGNKLPTKVYRQPTDTALLLHFQSRVDNRYKKGLDNTMVDRAYRLSSTKEALSTESERLRTMFPKLCYPKDIVDSSIHKFSHEHRERHATRQDPTVHKTLLFEDQRSANSVCKEIYS